MHRRTHASVSGSRQGVMTQTYGARAQQRAAEAATKAKAKLHGARVSPAIASGLVCVDLTHPFPQAWPVQAHSSA